MNNAEHTAAPHYFVPQSSPYPILASFSLLMITAGAVAWINQWLINYALFLVGASALIAVLFLWFRASVRESEAGLYSTHIDHSYRWSMSWFIFSEAIFFALFFSALFYIRFLAVPWLADLDHQLLWPNFSASWPTLGPADLVPSFHIVPVWPLPTINTIILLTSSFSLSYAHRTLKNGHRRYATYGLLVTVVLGLIFISCQAYEYHHAYQNLKLQFNSGAYGSLFFILTGFHALHVILGLVILTIILLRFCRGHFTADRHFGFEAASWYWHFVDAIWLGLYFIVYCL